MKTKTLVVLMPVITFIVMGITGLSLSSTPSRFTGAVLIAVGVLLYPLLNKIFYDSSESNKDYLPDA